MTFFIFACSDNGINQSFLIEKLGVNLELEDRIFSFEEIGSLQGEGMSLNIYRFRPLKNGVSIFKKNYPKSYDIREKWKISEWQNSSSYKEDSNLDLLSEYSLNDSKTKMKLEVLQTLLNREGSIYSYYYKEIDGDIFGLELYLIDKVNSKFYIYEILV